MGEESGGALGAARAGRAAARRAARAGRTADTSASKAAGQATDKVKDEAKGKAAQLVVDQVCALTGGWGPRIACSDDDGTTWSRQAVPGASLVAK